MPRPPRCPAPGLTGGSALETAAPPVRPGETVLNPRHRRRGIDGRECWPSPPAPRVIVTTLVARRAARVQALGADLVIDREPTPDWSAAVRAATEGAGVDRVLELGGEKTPARRIRATRVGGQIILIGNVTGNRPEIFLPAVLTGS